MKLKVSFSQLDSAAPRPLWPDFVCTYDFRASSSSGIAKLNGSEDLKFVNVVKDSNQDLSSLHYGNKVSKDKNTRSNNSKGLTLRLSIFFNFERPTACCSFGVCNLNPHVDTYSNQELLNTAMLVVNPFDFKTMNKTPHRGFQFISLKEQSHQQPMLRRQDITRQIK